MDPEVTQLVEMGATVAQAQVALKKAKNDVMRAAEMIFAGEIDDVPDRQGGSEPSREAQKGARPMTPDEDEDEDEEEDAAMDGGDSDDFDEDEDNEYGNDYDSDYEAKHHGKGGQAIDPYAGIFFSKSRREEVTEIDEEPEYASVAVTVTTEGNFITGSASTTNIQKLPILSQADFMRGCPEASEQSYLFSLYNKLSEPSRKCPNWQNCGGEVKTAKSEFLTIYPTFDAYTAALSQTVVKPCPKCAQNVCSACGEGTTVPIPGVQQPSHVPVYNSLFHCADLQGVILGMGLYMVDTFFSDGWLKSSGAKAGEDGEERASKKRKTGNVEADFTSLSVASAVFSGLHPGQGKKKASGTGYDGHAREDTTGQTEAQRSQNLRDAQLGLLMSQVRVYLPSLQRTGGGYPSDYLVSPTALAHLRRRFNHVASSLLRNDSLSDMSERSVLYFELFEWLQTVSNHEALASMVAMPIMIPSSSTEVGGQSKSQRVRQRLVVYEGSSGPRELMESLVIQATAAMKGLEGTGSSKDKGNKEMTEAQKRVLTANPGADAGKGKGKEKAVNQDNVRLLQFCERIILTANAIDRSLRETKGDAFVDRLHASLPKLPGSSRNIKNNVIAGPSSSSTSHPLTGPPLSLNASEAEAIKIYEEWGNAVRFEYCDLTIKPLPGQEPAVGAPDDTPSYMSVFSTDARMLAHADIPKRSLAIAKELAVLTTNLPVAWNSSIFLRVDETRVDVIKALITGPEGTPYYNGCYLFDIFLGPNYNVSAPSVKYMTTNGGKFRFNPNLYADGKVCLSLLGTWQGPGWVSGKSTLLQVLISIQSMILTDEPYLNEPGWANGSGTAASVAYSANVRRMVVHTAMLGNLKNPPEPFKDIILTHFRLKANNITKQLDDWLKMDDGKTVNGQGAGYSPGAATAGPGGSGAGSTFRAQVEEMKRLLVGLTRGQDPTQLSRDGAVGASVAVADGSASAPIAVEDMYDD
ncbi:hypothetical protein FRB95_001772 [Tulasnella sp. JGI-2019a]|nr:hypothetical protein FRB95_001772 [Tulasnella sp. JGI-2019a]